MRTRGYADADNGIRTKNNMSPPWWGDINDAGEMSMSEDSKQKAWLEHYQSVEFNWDPDHLSYQPPVEGPPIPITIDMVKKAISQMKAGKAQGPSGIVVEMI